MLGFHINYNFIVSLDNLQCNTFVVVAKHPLTIKVKTKMAPAKADTCTGCAKKIKKSGENVIICDECGCTQHTVCSGVPDEYADKSQDLRKYGFRWFCKACTDIKLGLTAANALPRDDLDEFKEELRSSVREITTNLKQMIESEVREAILSSRNLEKETADVLLQPPPPPSGDKSWAEVVGMQEGNSGFQTVKIGRAHV